MAKDHVEISPRTMLEETAASSTLAGISDEEAQKLKDNNIWAAYLDINGNKSWTVEAPDDLPQQFTIQDVALFSKGYLADYPVFVWNTDDGLLVLGYPKDSYTKLTSNYLSIRAIEALPLYITGMLMIDFLILFFAYYFSKRKIIKNTEPIIASIESLSDGKTVSFSAGGELSEVANSINKASRILSRQNEARANWISGISHDIRTPLSMIMGYAGRIVCDDTASCFVKEQAEIVRKQSLKIKELVQDLNLVSQLEYEMQPLHKQDVRISKLLRSYVAELLNTGLSDDYSLALEIAPDADALTMKCNERLILRAVNNLVQNSINHNPQGCEIKLCLDCSENDVTLVVEDNGVGLAPEKLKELEEKPHYMESTDDRLDLRHGLGLVLVRQIVEVHSGNMQIKSTYQQGCTTTLIFKTHIHI